jgi:hypothetical protein
MNNKTKENLENFGYKVGGSALGTGFVGMAAGQGLANYGLIGAGAVGAGITGAAIAGGIGAAAAVGHQIVKAHKSRKQHAAEAFHNARK